MSRVLISFIVIAVGFVSFSNASRILCIFPYPSHSHQVAIQHIVDELLNRGHELVVFTPFPKNDSSIKNYTEISLSYLVAILRDNTNFVQINRMGYYTFLKKVYHFCDYTVDNVLSSPAMKKLIAPDSNEKFDLIIIQSVFYHAFFALSARFNAPVIGISTVALFLQLHIALGNPLMMAYSPHLLLNSMDENSLSDRMWNVFYYVRGLYDLYTIEIPNQNKLVRKHFGDDMPSVEVLWKNMSVVMVTINPMFQFPRPNVPGIIDIGGFRFKNKKTTTPADLKKLLDNAQSGVIYFSLGTNVKSVDLPIETRNVLLNAFRELPYTILWKFESDEFLNKPDNVIIRKWFPQQAILAHPNVKAFISQGGMQSIEESIENKVPIVSMPVISDQFYNSRRIEEFGMSKTLNLFSVEKDTLKSVIQEVVTNPKYKKNTERVRELMNDLPHDQLNETMWWIEYVIRHKGAHHLQCKGRHMPWYQVELVDIFAIALIVLFASIYILFAVLRYIFRKLIRSNEQSKVETEKRSKKHD